MTTLGFARLEPRRVVLATVADARMAEAASELEKLRAHLLHITAEVEAGEQRADTPPNELELPESAQLTLQFVDDLVATNRGRMRDQVAQRYVWAGERLTGAHAEAQAMVGDALAELTAAVREHNAPPEHPVDELPSVAVMASMAPVVPISQVSSTVETAPDVTVEHAPGADDAVADELEARPGIGANDAAAPQGAAADCATEPGTPLPDHRTPAARLAAEVDAPVALDGVVDSAVQAILKALTEPGIDSPPSPPTATATPLVTPPPGLLTSPADGASGSLASGPTPAADERASSIADDAEPPPGAVDALGDDVLGRGYEDFWRDTAHAAESRPSRLRPRDVVVAMLLLVALVVTGLAFIG